MLKVPATVSKVTTMADSCIRLFVDCQEMCPEDRAELMGLYNQLGVFVFSISNITEEDIKDLPEVSKRDGKTKSQRLRGSIFRLWERSTSGKDFDKFYDDYMERLIEKIKEQLD